MADDMKKYDPHDQKSKSSGQQDENPGNCEPENDNKADHKRLIIEPDDLGSEEVAEPQKNEPTISSELLIVEIDDEPLQQDNNNSLINTGGQPIDVKKEPPKTVAGLSHDNLSPNDTFSDDSYKSKVRTVKDAKPVVFSNLQSHRGQRADKVQYAAKVINARTGNIPISHLEVGDRVVDPSWEWEFRSTDNYKITRKAIKKPVEWIIVAKNHYEGFGPHVTLLAVECIACYAFDDAGFWGRNGDVNQGCYSLWGLSGTHEAKVGLRPWLNSIDINKGSGFYEAFSNEFKTIVLTTPLPNKDGADNAYITADNVFIPSTTELGDKNYRHTHPIGKCFPYFNQASNAVRVAALPGKANNWPWWTRSPDKVSRAMVSSSSSLIDRIFDEVVGVDMKRTQEFNDFIRRYIDKNVGGEGLKVGKDVCVIDRGNFSYAEASEGYRGVRPVVNINANALVLA
jgi:hypothetical protein